jgi:hypothetical protein
MGSILHFVDSLQPSGGRNDPNGRGFSAAGDSQAAERIEDEVKSTESSYLFSFASSL